MESGEKVLYTTGANRRPIWGVTGERIKAFADRNDAEVVEVSPNKHKAWWVLFDAMADSLDSGRHSAWIDDDIIVGNHAESVWKYGDRFMVCEPAFPSRVHPRWKRMFRKHGVPNQRPYPTTGVVSWKPNQNIERLVGWFHDGIDAGSFDTSWGDQELLALAVWELDLPFHYFPTELHGTRVLEVGGFYQMFHPGGPAKKVERLTRLNKRMEIVEAGIALSRGLAGNT